MKREIPVLANPELDLYTRTYYSLLRSSGEVEVRAFEEAHAYSLSTLHEGALDVHIDLSAFSYAAGRLPTSMIEVKRLILGQSHELFEADGYDVRSWRVERTRGRRRPLRYDGRGTLAVFIASASDIDDLVPIVTAYQIEWNKMHHRLRQGLSAAAPAKGLGGRGEDRNKRGKSGSRDRVPNGPPSSAQLKAVARDKSVIATALGVDADGLERLQSAFGGEDQFWRGIDRMIKAPMRLRMRMLSASHSQYQRSAQRWWSGVEPHYVQKKAPRRPPVYFVSSNTHAVANLLGGYARAHAKDLTTWVKQTNPEGLADELLEAEAAGDEDRRWSLLYYLLRGYIHAKPSRMGEVRAYEADRGLIHLNEPGHIDVDAQIIHLSKLDAGRIDHRLRVPQLDRLKKSDAVIINIDYPLGMAAYHLLSRVGQGVGEIRGIHVMGKAATLNGRVGDVMVSGTVFDEHSRNTFLFHNAFSAKDVIPHLTHGSVFDSQRALTVRSAFLQNKDYMSGFYREGYTVLEMEAGPFLSAMYELVNPTRVPQGEIVHLSSITPFDVGILHYASDTPYSRRQSLLSKSLSYFGVDSTYACALAIVKRIIERELSLID